MAHLSFFKFAQHTLGLNPAVNSSVEREAAGLEAGAGGRAGRLQVVLFQHNAAQRHLVHVGRADLLAVAEAQVVVACVYVLGEAMGVSIRSAEMESNQPLSGLDGGRIRSARWKPFMYVLKGTLLGHIW